MKSDNILRIPGNVPTRHWGSAYRDIACVLGMSDDFSLPFEDQARRAFDALDRGLAFVGSDRTRLLSVLVYLADISRKGEFDRMWSDWIVSEPQHWPMRSCVQVTFAAGNQIEMIAWCVRKSDQMSNS
jgi:enamine deaminase RidA (YjgF/YER057c/UK114 family)